MSVIEPLCTRIHVFSGAFRILYTKGVKTTVEEFQGERRSYLTMLTTCISRGGGGVNVDLAVMVLRILLYSYMHVYGILKQTLCIGMYMYVIPSRGTFSLSKPRCL